MRACVRRQRFRRRVNKIVESLYSAQSRCSIRKEAERGGGGGTIGQPRDLSRKSVQHVYLANIPERRQKWWGVGGGRQGNGSAKNPLARRFLLPFRAGVNPCSDGNDSSRKMLNLKNRLGSRVRSERRRERWRDIYGYNQGNAIADIETPLVRRFLWPFSGYTWTST